MIQVEIIPTGPLSVNTYILKDEESKEAIIIDVGGSFTKIKQILDEQGYKIKCILNTHGHFDHVLGDIEIQKLYPKIPIYMHKDDYSHIENMLIEMSAFGYSMDGEKISINEFIDEKSQINLGENKIEIFHVPGHSKGSLAYYVDNKLFSGDALFYRSIGRTDFYDGDYNTLINSIKTKILSLPNETVVYPGHGPKTTVQYEKKYNEFLQ